MKVGIDSVLVKRFEKMENLDAFLNKYFTEYEIKYINGKGEHKFETMAGLYSAKEAFLKALQIGIGAGISLKSVEIRHNNKGAPFVEITAFLKGFLASQVLKEVSLSITHTKNQATAICIIN
jgi:holo-[acyl-carrier protein] synthase